MYKNMHGNDKLQIWHNDDLWGSSKLGIIVTSWRIEKGLGDGGAHMEFSF